jgi:hypothetical protein
MGVAGYFPGGLRERRRELRNAVAEVARSEDAAVEPLGLADVLGQVEERHELVEDYDPVLRAHCRLDKVG